MSEAMSMACFCCHQSGKEGISIAGQFLCRDCERLLVELQPGDDNYPSYVDRCKAIWDAFSNQPETTKA